MVVNKKQEVPTCNVKVENTTIKQVDKFNYLGSTVTQDSRCDHDIKK